MSGSCDVELYFQEQDVLILHFEVGGEGGRDNRMEANELLDAFTYCTCFSAISDGGIGGLAATTTSVLVAFVTS